MVSRDRRAELDECIDLLRYAILAARAAGSMPTLVSISPGLFVELGRPTHLHGLPCMCDAGTPEGEIYLLMPCDDDAHSVH